MPGWDTYANGVLYSPSTSYPNYDEPIMGNAPNCSCIASMASLAWVNPVLIKQKISSAMSQVIFPGAGTVQMTPYLWLNNGNILYANDSFSSAPTYEIWPSIYEKGFAKMAKGITTQLPEPPITTMTTADWYNYSLIPLSYMTGWNPDPTTLAGMKVTDVETKLGSYCEWDGFNAAQTKYPGIAWTATAAGTNPAGQIYQNHSYSILGMYLDGNLQKWVILRDPKRSGSPANALNLPNGWHINHGWYMRGGNKNNASALYVPLSNGTFGITTATFTSLFSAFGFVL